jgi:hypothetical protein
MGWRGERYSEDAGVELKKPPCPVELFLRRLSPMRQLEIEK